MFVVVEIIRGNGCFAFWFVYVKTCVPEMFNQNNENVFQRLIWKDDQIIRNADYPIILTEISEVENNPFVRGFLALP